MAYEIEEDTIYYFLCQAENKYHTLFIGWLRHDLVSAFEQLDDEKGKACIRIIVGAHTFVSYVDSPLFLVEFEKDEIFEFASDDNMLEVFAGIVDPLELDIPPVINYPNYFTKGVEPLLDYKLGKQFCVQKNGIWVPLLI